MEGSVFLARLISIFCLAMGASMFVRRKMLISIFRDLSKNRTLSYILGVLILIIGIILVLSHNIWTKGFPLLITILGWLVFLEGSFYLFASSKMVGKYIAKMEVLKFYYIIAISYLVIGIYLIYFGFFA